MTRRTERLAAEMQRQLAEILTPLQPQGMLLTITRVVVSPDNRSAHVWLAGWENVSLEDQKRLRHNLQAGLAALSTTKFTPHINLKTDTSADYAENIARLLDSSNTD